MKMIKKPIQYTLTAAGWILFWTPMLIYGIIKMLDDKYYEALPVFMILFLTIVYAIYWLMYSINFSVEVTKDYVTITDWLRRKKIYNFKDLYIKWRIDSFIVYNGNNKRLTKVSVFDSNFDKIKKLKVKW